MARWLYNSDGDPVAFLSGKNVFSQRGGYIGRLEADQQVWNGEYIGELYADDRFFYNTNRLFSRRPLPGIPPLPGFVGEPVFRGPLTLPLGFQDVRIK